MNSVTLVIYVDERRELGQQALQILEDYQGPLVTIPVDGGIPFVVRGRSRYNGFDEIELLMKDLTK